MYFTAERHWDTHIEERLKISHMLVKHSDDLLPRNLTRRDFNAFMCTSGHLDHLFELGMLESLQGLHNAQLLKHSALMHVYLPGQLQ